MIRESIYISVKVDNEFELEFQAFMGTSTENLKFELGQNFGSALVFNK